MQLVDATQEESLAASHGQWPGGWGARALQCAEIGVVSAGCWVFDRAVHNPYCALLFRCGCTFEWAGGWLACNVHQPAVDQDGQRNPARCPWCAVMEGDLKPLAVLITHSATVLVMISAYIAVWSGRMRLCRVTHSLFLLWLSLRFHRFGLFSPPLAADKRPLVIAIRSGCWRKKQPGRNPAGRNGRRERSPASTSGALCGV